jgi:hypothetical protein
MSKFTKIAAGTLAALTITVGALATSSTEAHAKKFFFGGKGLGFGLAAGVIGAAAFAAHASHYHGVVGCRYVERYDVFGNYLGTRKVCRYL